MHFLLLLLSLAAPAFADNHCDLSSIDWSKSTEMTVVLERFRFHPRELDFVACKPYKLIIFNNSGSIAHAFTAPAFFKSVKIRNPDTGDLSTPSYEELNLAAQTQIELLLVPTATGSYSLWCSHRYHPTLGMKGWIYVGAK